MFNVKFEINLDSSLAPKVEHKSNLFFRHGSFAWWPHKHWEIQIAQWSLDTLLSVEIDLRMRGSDHAGPKFCVEILGRMFDIHMYDSRHWNYEKNRWEQDGDEEEDE